ncbi:MAG: hypothetical protein WD851_17250 [Pirellulales bacterium]
MKSISDSCVPPRWSRAVSNCLAALLLVGVVASAAPASDTVDPQVEKMPITQAWSWSGHRPRQAGELIAMGKKALEKEARRKVDEWNSAPGPIHYKLVAIEFKKNSPCKDDYDRNKVTGVRTSWARGTARGVMIVQFDTD